MKRFGTEGELLQHIIDMCHDNYHGISVEQAKAWAEHELRDVTQQVDSVAKACASRTHALWTKAHAHEVSAGSDQQDMTKVQVMWAIRKWHVPVHPTI
jgi:hypothetical protein